MVPSSGKDVEQQGHITSGIAKCYNHSDRLAIYYKIKYTLILLFNLSIPGTVFMRNEWKQYSHKNPFVHVYSSPIHNCY